MIIVYRSNTGFTKQYAQMLGQSEKMKVLELSEALDSLNKEDKVFFFGPLMAGHIQGIDQAVKHFTVQAVCGVGMSPPAQSVLSLLARSNYVPNAPIFYLQGGYAPKKLGWTKRQLVAMATKGLRTQLQAKLNRTPQEQANLDMLLKGGSFVAFQNLKPIQNWLAQQR